MMKPLLEHVRRARAQRGGKKEGHSITASQLFQNVPSHQWGLGGPGARALVRGPGLAKPVGRVLARISIIRSLL